MSRYGVKVIETGKWEDIVFRKVKSGNTGHYMICLGDQKIGPQIMGSTEYGWAAIPWRRKRGQALGRFRTRLDAGLYCLWADGVIDEDYSLL